MSQDICKVHGRLRCGECRELAGLREENAKLRTDLATERAANQTLLQGPTVSELKAELAVARERLGPAGYKIIQEVARLRNTLEHIHFMREEIGTRPEADTARTMANVAHAALLGQTGSATSMPNQCSQGGKFYPTAHDELEARIANSDSLTCIQGVYHRSPCAKCSSHDCVDEEKK